MDSKVRLPMLIVLFVLIPRVSFGERQDPREDCDVLGHFRGTLPKYLSGGCCLRLRDDVHGRIHHVHSNDTLCSEPQSSLSHEDFKRYLSEITTSTSVSVSTIPLFGYSPIKKRFVPIRQTETLQIFNQTFCIDDVCSESRCKQNYELVPVNGGSDFVYSASGCVVSSVRSKRDLLLDRIYYPDPINATNMFLEASNVSPRSHEGNRDPRRKTFGAMTIEYNECSAINGDHGARKCVFPFKFQNVTHFGCTYAGDSHPWCATEHYSDLGYKTDKWGYCTATCPIELPRCKTVSGPRINAYCQFPFTYKDQQHWNCITQDDVRPWCATSVDGHGYLIDPNWGYCSDDCHSYPDVNNLQSSFSCDKTHQTVQRFTTPPRNNHYEHPDIFIDVVRLSTRTYHHEVDYYGRSLDEKAVAGKQHTLPIDFEKIETPVGHTITTDPIIDYFDHGDEEKESKKDKVETDDPEAMNFGMVIKKDPKYTTNTFASSHSYPTLISNLSPSTYSTPFEKSKSSPVIPNKTTYEHDDREVRTEKLEHGKDDSDTISKTEYTRESTKTSLPHDIRERDKSNTKSSTKTPSSAQLLSSNKSKSFSFTTISIDKKKEAVDSNPNFYEGKEIKNYPGSTIADHHISKKIDAESYETKDPSKYVHVHSSTTRTNQDPYNSSESTTNYHNDKDPLHKNHQNSKKIADNSTRKYSLQQLKSNSTVHPGLTGNYSSVETTKHNAAHKDSRHGSPTTFSNDYEDDITTEYNTFSTPMKEIENSVTYSTKEVPSISKDIYDENDILEKNSKSSTTETMSKLSDESKLNEGTEYMRFSSTKMLEATTNTRYDDDYTPVAKLNLFSNIDEDEMSIQDGSSYGTSFIGSMSTKPMEYTNPTPMENSNRKISTSDKPRELKKPDTSQKLYAEEEHDSSEYSSSSSVYREKESVSVVYDGEKENDDLPVAMAILGKGKKTRNDPTSTLGYYDEVKKTSRIPSKTEQLYEGEGFLENSNEHEERVTTDYKKTTTSEFSDDKTDKRPSNKKDKVFHTPLSSQSNSRYETTTLSYRESQPKKTDDLTYTNPAGKDHTLKFETSAENANSKKTATEKTRITDYKYPVGLIGIIQSTTKSVPSTITKDSKYENYPAKNDKTEDNPNVYKTEDNLNVVKTDYSSKISSHSSSKYETTTLSERESLPKEEESILYSNTENNYKNTLSSENDHYKKTTTKRIEELKGNKHPVGLLVDSKSSNKNPIFAITEKSEHDGLLSTTSKTKKQNIYRDNLPSNESSQPSSGSKITTLHEKKAFTVKKDELTTYQDVGVDGSNLQSKTTTGTNKGKTTSTRRYRVFTGNNVFGMNLVPKSAEKESVTVATKKPAYDYSSAEKKSPTERAGTSADTKFNSYEETSTNTEPSNIHLDGTRTVIAKVAPGKKSKLPHSITHWGEEKNPSSSSYDNEIKKNEKKKFTAYTDSYNYQDTLDPMNISPTQSNNEKEDYFDSDYNRWSSTTSSWPGDQNYGYGINTEQNEAHKAIDPSSKDDDDGLYYSSTEETKTTEKSKNYYDSDVETGFNEASDRYPLNDIDDIIDLPHGLFDPTPKNPVAENDSKKTTHYLDYFDSLLSTATGNKDSTPQEVKEDKSNRDSNYDGWTSTKKPEINYGESLGSDSDELVPIEELDSYKPKDSPDDPHDLVTESSKPVDAVTSSYSSLYKDSPTTIINKGSASQNEDVYQESENNDWAHSKTTSSAYDVYTSGNPRKTSPALHLIESNVPEKDSYFEHDRKETTANKPKVAHVSTTPSYSYDQDKYEPPSALKGESVTSGDDYNPSKAPALVHSKWSTTEKSLYLYEELKETTAKQRTKKPHTSTLKEIKDLPYASYDETEATKGLKKDYATTTTIPHLNSGGHYDADSVENTPESTSWYQYKTNGFDHEPDVKGSASVTEGKHLLESIAEKTTIVSKEKDTTVANEHNKGLTYHLFGKVSVVPTKSTKKQAPTTHVSNYNDKFRSTTTIRRESSSEVNDGKKYDSHYSPLPSTKEPDNLQKDYGSYTRYKSTDDDEIYNSKVTTVKDTKDLLYDAEKISAEQNKYYTPSTTPKYLSDDQYYTTAGKDAYPLPSDLNDYHHEKDPNAGIWLNTKKSSNTIANEAHFQLSTNSWPDKDGGVSSTLSNDKNDYYQDNNPVSSESTVDDKDHFVAADDMGTAHKPRLEPLEVKKSEYEDDGVKLIGSDDASKDIYSSDPHGQSSSELKKFRDTTKKVDSVKWDNSQIDIHEGTTPDRHSSSKLEAFQYSYGSTSTSSEKYLDDNYNLTPHYESSANEKEKNDEEYTKHNVMIYTEGYKENSSTEKQSHDYHDATSKETSKSHLNLQTYPQKEENKHDSFTEKNDEKEYKSKQSLQPNRKTDPPSYTSYSPYTPKTVPLESDYGQVDYKDSSSSGMAHTEKNPHTSWTQVSKATKSTSWIKSEQPLPEKIVDEYYSKTESTKAARYTTYQTSKESHEKQEIETPQLYISTSSKPKEESIHGSLIGNYDKKDTQKPLEEHITSLLKGYSSTLKSIVEKSTSKELHPMKEAYISSSISPEPIYPKKTSPKAASFSVTNKLSGKAEPFSSGSYYTSPPSVRHEQGDSHLMGSTPDVFNAYNQQTDAVDHLSTSKSTVKSKFEKPWIGGDNENSPNKIESTKAARYTEQSSSVRLHGELHLSTSKSTVKSKFEKPWIGGDNENSPNKIESTKAARYTEQSSTVRLHEEEDVKTYDQYLNTEVPSTPNKEQQVYGSFILDGNEVSVVHKTSTSKVPLHYSEDLAQKTTKPSHHVNDEYTSSSTQQRPFFLKETFIKATPSPQSYQSKGKTDSIVGHTTSLKNIISPGYEKGDHKASSDGSALDNIILIHRTTPAVKHSTNSRSTSGNKFGKPSWESTSKNSYSRTKSSTRPVEYTTTARSHKELGIKTSDEHWITVNPSTIKKEVQVYESIVEDGVTEETKKPSTTRKTSPSTVYSPSYEAHTQKSTPKESLHTYKEDISSSTRGKPQILSKSSTKSPFSSSPSTTQKLSSDLDFIFKIDSALKESKKCIPPLHAKEGSIMYINTEYDDPVLDVLKRGGLDLLAMQV